VFFIKALSTNQGKAPKALTRWNNEYLHLKVVLETQISFGFNIVHKKRPSAKKFKAHAAADDAVMIYDMTPEVKCGT